MNWPFINFGYNRNDINIKKETDELRPGECKKMTSNKGLIRKESYWMCNENGKIITQENESDCNCAINGDDKHA